MPLSGAEWRWSMALDMLAAGMEAGEASRSVMILMSARVDLTSLDLS